MADDEIFIPLAEPDPQPEPLPIQPQKPEEPEKTDLENPEPAQPEQPERPVTPEPQQPEPYPEPQPEPQLPDYPEPEPAPVEPVHPKQPEPEPQPAPTQPEEPQEPHRETYPEPAPQPDPEPRQPREADHQQHQHKLNVIRNHEGDFEFTSTTTSIQTWHDWNRDLWAKIVYLIAEGRESSIFQKIAVGEANPAAGNPQFHDFTDGADHFVVSDVRKWAEGELHQFLNENFNAFERGDLWIGFSRENVNPSNIFSDVFSRILRGEQIGDGHDVECVGKVGNGEKLLWHKVHPNEWGAVESKVANLSKALTMDFLINGYLRP
ncbi:unnamed protein product, partial [Mesorhabditis belari]|uniref:Uncharacterized protein n=1 Tax=Mesorhabditis belari TaxID=2138241 RepID=A0AAF3J3X1_9BILA